jgi:hypothetical protein
MVATTNALHEPPEQVALEHDVRQQLTLGKVLLKQRAKFWNLLNEPGNRLALVRRTLRIGHAEDCARLLLVAWQERPHRADRALLLLPPCDSAAAGGPFVPRAVAIRPLRASIAPRRRRSLSWGSDTADRSHSDFRRAAASARSSRAVVCVAAIRAFSRLPRSTLPSIVRDSDCETMELDPGCLRTVGGHAARCPRAAAARRSQAAPRV